MHDHIKEHHSVFTVMCDAVAMAALFCSYKQEGSLKNDSKREDTILKTQQCSYNETAL